MADDLQPPAGGNAAGNAIEDDSDWEYEYHETETETFYVTVDLSSSSSNVRVRDKRGPPNSTTAESPPIAEYNEAATSPVQSPTLDPSEAVQILDFHTSNPLISYQGRLYSCQWSTTLGTDLLLTRSQSSESPVLAATRIKLSGRPVRMIRHRGASKPNLQPLDEAVQTQQDTVEPIPPQINSPIHPQDKNPAVQRPVLEIPLDRHASVARQNQAHFLERLSAIKAARGEQDEVTVYAKKRFTGTGWRSRQRAQKDADDESEDDETMAIGQGDEDDDRDGDGEGEDQNGGAATGFRRIQAPTPSSRAVRQKNPRSRGRGRRERAGLFRDYRPTAGKGNGESSIRKDGPGNGIPTPTESDSRATGSAPAPQPREDPRTESGQDSLVAADADPTIGPFSAAVKEGTGNKDETGDVPMEDV
ncbi:hypothetical protein MMC29_005092 [Sticta canariensis]|nr:hypothetical protein [Sticta canariensis]